MEKTLSRKIGYKPNTTEVVKPAKQKATAPTKVVQPPATTAQDIVAFIKSHPLIAWGRMCVQLNIDKGNFQKALLSERPSISAENILKIEAALKDYGFCKNGK